MKLIHARWPGHCQTCKKRINKGEAIYWEHKIAIHQRCYSNANNLNEETTTMTKYYTCNKAGLVCSICSAPIFLGHNMNHNRSISGQYAHEQCLEANGGKFPKVETIFAPFIEYVDIDTPEITPTKEFLAKELAKETTVMTPAKPTTPSTGLESMIAEAIMPLVEQRIEPLIRQLAVLDPSKLEQTIKDTLASLTRRIEVVHPTGETIDVGEQHFKFDTLLKACMARDAKGNKLNLWLCGPAGTGKTTAAENVGKALNLERIVVLPKLSESYTFFGYHVPGTGEYKRTPARDVWEFGGMLVMDDFDGTDPNVATELNAPLANGTCMFPDGMVPRHKDTVIILTANTWGHGATNEYVGRLKQDAAFMNRFVTVDWPIDEQLERSTVGHDKWVSRVQTIRAKVASKGIKVLVTPRQSYFGAALLNVGMDWNTVENMVLKASMTDEQWKGIQ